MSQLDTAAETTLAAQPSMRSVECNSELAAVYRDLWRGTRPLLGECQASNRSATQGRRLETNCISMVSTEPTISHRTYIQFEHLNKSFGMESLQCYRLISAIALGPE